MYKQKTVPVKVDAKASGGVESYKISVQPANVTIYAENEVLETVNEVLTNAVNLDEMTEESVTVEIKLPDGVFLRDGVDVVTVKAEKRG